jgi:cell division protein FtsX
MAGTAEPQSTGALAAGFGIGILWLIMAVTCLASAARGFANDRSDWGVTWGLVGLLLAAAGTAAMVGTWWHHTRVLRDDAH